MIYSLSNNFPKSMFITWEIMNTCNYKCSYCSPELYGGTAPMPDYNNALSFFNRLDEENTNKKILSLSGGEPTLWPKLPIFLKELSDSYSIEIVTNGSRTIRWWGDLFNQIDKIDRISLSVHLEFAKKEHILKVCQEIHNKCTLTVMILFDLKFIETAIDLATDLKDLNLNLSMRLKPIIAKDKQFGKSEYSDVQRDIIKGLEYNNAISLRKIEAPASFIVNGESKTIYWANNLIAENKHTFKGMFCEAGNKRLYIDYKGTIFGATCETAKLNPLGNINDNTFIKINGMICNSDFCPCVPDIRIPKFKVNV
jgi:MoaA/NifB/PqqE/SkfB family radical SAM enzyme